jgi:hypothetical protein
MFSPGSQNYRTGHHRSSTDFNRSHSMWDEHLWVGSLVSHLCLLDGITKMELCGRIDTRTGVFLC